LRSFGNLTNASVGLIQNFTSDLLSVSVSHLKKKTVKFLKEANVDKSVADNFISETFDFSNHFHGFETTDNQLDFFSQKYALVKPVDMYLSSRIEHRLDRKTHVFTNSGTRNISIRLNDWYIKSHCQEQIFKKFDSV